MVVDDGSGPEYGPFLASLPAGITVVRLPRNSGPSAARNAGVDAARSPFVAFLDSDDWWAPAKLERQVAHIAARPDCDAVHTAVVIARGEELRRSVCQKPRRLDERSILARRAVITSSLVVRRERFLACGGFDERIRSSEDYDFSIRLVASGAAVDFLPEFLTLLRRDRHTHISADWRRVLRGQWQVAWKHRALITREYGTSGFVAKLIAEAHHASYKSRSTLARALRLSLTPFVSSRFGDPAPVEEYETIAAVERRGL
ncbi:MAG TPA: glycosyltransferase [Steroidobacteraceae bacterium]|nr:glycosyltransferase [Steroidobacteraceae bacterium]